MTIRWYRSAHATGPAADTNDPGIDLSRFLVMSERQALAVLGREHGWVLGSHEYGAVLRGPVAADCTDTAIDAVWDLQQHGWALSPWNTGPTGEPDASYGPIVLLSPGAAAAQRLVHDLATALLQELLVDMVKTWRGKAGRDDRIAYRRRQLARRRRNRR